MHRFWDSVSVFCLIFRLAFCKICYNIDRLHTIKRTYFYKENLYETYYRER